MLLSAPVVTKKSAGYSLILLLLIPPHNGIALYLTCNTMYCISDILTLSR